MLFMMLITHNDNNDNDRKHTTRQHANIKTHTQTNLKSGNLL